MNMVYHPWRTRDTTSPRYIASALSTQPFPRGTPQKTHFTLRSAADVPIELYDLILHFLEPPRVGSEFAGAQTQRNKVRAKKAELGRLALVCWSWAQLCQPKIFEIVVLRSHVEFQQLLALAAHPCSRISRYIEKLELMANNKVVPWLHVVCKQILPKCGPSTHPGSPFPNYEGHNLVLAGSMAVDVLLRGPHASLPRRPPPVFLRHIVTLAIMDATLPGIGEVARLRRELPSLEELGCYGVAWAVRPAADDTLVDRRRLGLGRAHQTPVQEVQMDRSADAWAALPLLCLWDSARPLRADGISVLAKLARELTGNTERQPYATPVMVQALQTARGYGLVVTSSFLHQTPILWIWTTKDTDSEDWHIDTVALQFFPPARQAMMPILRMGDYAWEEFDEQLCGLAALRQVVVAVQSEDDLAVFSQVIGHRMARLQSSPKLRFALGRHDLAQLENLVLE